MKLPGKGMPDIAAFLAGNSSLENLQLVNVRLDSSSGCLIARALMSNTTLTALNLAANRLGPKFATACCQLLEYNNHLEILNLSENELTDRALKHLPTVCGKIRNSPSYASKQMASRNAEGWRSPVCWP
jgi:Ran GTPase-activating protein (RanGAP) involved in mRNA processing and transport